MYIYIYIYTVYTLGYIMELKNNGSSYPGKHLLKHLDPQNQWQLGFNGDTIGDMWDTVKISVDYFSKGGSSCVEKVHQTM